MGSASGVLSSVKNNLKSVVRSEPLIKSAKICLSSAVAVSMIASPLVGCSPRSKMANVASADISAAASEQGAQSATPGMELARRTLLAPDMGQNADYTLDIVERDATSEIEIALADSTANTMASKPVITTLEAPSRIVVDLEGSKGPKSSVIETPESLFVSRVRIGAHPDKSRIVLDLNDGQVVLPSLEEENGKYILRLAKGDTTASASETARSMNFDEAGTPSIQEASIQESIQPEIMAQASKESEALMARDLNGSIELAKEEFTEPSTFSSAKLQETAVEESANTKISDLNEVSEAAKPTSSVQVYSYQLQAVSPTENTLIIEGDKLANHSLNRTAPSEYVLKLPGANLVEGAQETLVAPQGSGAIRSVRAKSTGNNLELRIFTTPEESLEVKSSKEGLVVAASSGFDIHDALAQPSPEIVKDSARDTVAANKEVSVVGNDDTVDSEINSLLGEQPKYSGRLISLDLQDTDIDNALRIIAEVSNLNIIASDEVTGKITLRLIDVPWDQALDVILKTNGLDQIQENNVIRIAPVEKLRNERESLKQARQAEEELEPLGVRYVRISYAKAAELKALVESVLSERGSVAYDERTNQLIIKDIRKGVLNVAELITKLDLRTPQVLLETQIVEATRSLSRDLGAEFGFNFIQSPATGNATGYNFPNSVAIGGSGPDGNISSFPAPEGSAITFLLESADGTRSLSTRLSALETEGRVKIVSRPAVATTNNKQATIKSVEKIRVKQPSGGLSVATGQGASASGTGTATETIEIGIVLEVTPQASPDYYVLLDINAKSSTLGSQLVDGIPSEIERSATNSVLVSSGQTFAMGGIYKTQDRSGVTGIPYLKDIPVLGHLFRSTTVNNQDEELLFFITPRIIEGSFDDAAMKAS